jgi:acyl carrier protein
MLSRDEIQDLVVASLHELCDDDDAEITDETNPKEDLDLDSEDGIEFACEISERMGKLFPNDLNPFVDDKASCIRNVGAIVDFLNEIQSELQSLDSHDDK